MGTGSKVDERIGDLKQNWAGKASDGDVGLIKVSANLEGSCCIEYGTQPGAP